MLLLASAYERSGSIELAEKQYADVARVSNFEPSVVLNYVTFLRRRGDNPRAENVLTELASRWPKNETVLSALAQVRLALQNWTGAQEVAGTIRNLGNDRGTADQILGAALSGLSRYQESIGVLQQAYAANPGAAQPMIGLFNALVGAGKVGEAVTFLQTVLASDPDNAEAYVLLGSIQLGNNASQEALKSFQAAIERQPKKTAAYQALANLHLREKNTEEALRVVHAGLDQQPNSFGLRLTLAGILEIKKDYESAIREYEHMLKQDPGSLIVANNLASLLSDRRTDKASLDRALSLAGVLRKSQIPAFKDTLGWIYYQRGDYNSAIPLLEEAVAELPQRGIVHYHLGMSYVSAGQLGKASEQLKKAVMLVPQDDDLQAKISAAQERAASN
jgi:tetratricopeptide (TPR) repeat protein